MFSSRLGWFSQAIVQGNVRRVGAADTLTPVTFSSGAGGGNFSTTRAQFGAGSLDVSTTNDDVFLNSYSGPWPSGTGDFCIEGWVWVPSARSRTVVGHIGGLNTTNGLQIRFGEAYSGSSFNYIQILARGQADLDRAPITWPNETWTHWAVQRKSAVISLWAGGVKLARENGPTAPGTAASRSFAAPSASQIVWGSYQTNANDQNALVWLDEICVSSSWRYDDAFSTYVVPTEPFFVDEFTDMLIHFDSNLQSAAS